MMGKPRRSMLTRALPALVLMAAAACGSSAKNRTGTGGVAGGAAGLGGTAGSGGGASGSGGGVAAGDSVLMNHKNLNRDGLYVQPALTKAAAAGLHKLAAFTPAT